MTFNDPWALLLLGLIPLIVSFYLKKRVGGSISFSSIKTLQGIQPSWRIKARHLVIVLRGIALVLIILALARPQKGNENTRIFSEGIDIILAIDRSGSMRAHDFIVDNERHDRLYAVKKVVQDFIRKRGNDRIGMTVFAGFAYTQCPLTLDYGVLMKFIEQTQIVENPQEDGTAIGDALGLSVNALKERPVKSKVIILLSDGDNNTGIDPLTTADVARTFGCKIYTIGAGHTGLAPFPGKDWFGNDVLVQQSVVLNEETLKKIAEITGGKYFHAEDTKALERTYDEINRLERTKAEVRKYTDYNELFPIFLLPGLGLMILGMILENTLFRKLP